MAGMLPGVEAARIRRIHQSNLDNGGGGGRSRRSFFCLYATNYQELRISSPSSMKPERNNSIRWADGDDENLEASAREAKKRLDQRLQKLWKSEIKRKQKREKDRI